MYISVFLYVFVILAHILFLFLFFAYFWNLNGSSCNTSNFSQGSIMYFWFWYWKQAAHLWEFFRPLQLRTECHNGGQRHKQRRLKSHVLMRYTGTTGRQFCMGIINVRSAVVSCYLEWEWQGLSHWVRLWMSCCLPRRNGLSGNSAWQKER